jgi:hypothetical protein
VGTELNKEMIIREQLGSGVAPERRDAKLLVVYGVACYIKKQTG